MSRTPDKLEVTAIKINKLEKTEKTVTQYRALQTDRKAQEKPSEKTKSPLMLMLLLKKKIKARLEHSFMRINLQKNKASYQKIIVKYMSSILKYKIKANESSALQKFNNNAKRFRNLRNLCISLGSWMKTKIRFQKALGFNRLLSRAQNAVQQQKQQPKYEIPSRPPLKDSKLASSVKKPEANRSLDLGNKSVSASKLNLSKKIDFEGQPDLPQEIAKIRKQNEELKLMELSEDAREALKKVQRFDRFIYAQETQKVCKDVLSIQLKRLQKIKNSQKQMRVQFYDNELTITALFNHIKLISEMNRDIFDLSKMKEKYEGQEAKRKQQQFKANLSNRRNRGKQPNTEAALKQITENIELNLVKKQYEKARQDILTLLSKHEKEESIQDRITLYRALSQALAASKETDKTNWVQEIENERTKSRSLTEKIKDLEKLNREQTIKITSIEKEKKELQSGKKPPLQNRSVQILKTQGSVPNGFQVEVKQYKEKIQALQKEILTLKASNEKKQLSEKKETKVGEDKKLPEENKRLQEEIKKLQEELKVRKQKEIQQRAEKNKEAAIQVQVSKTITTITTIFQTRNLKQLQIEANKFLKITEKDEKLSGISTLLVNLIKMLIEREATELTRKKQLDTLTESQGKDKEKLDALTKLTKESEVEIKSGSYLANPDYWDKYLTGLDPRTSGVVKDLIKILKMLTLEIKSKTTRLDQISSKSKVETSTVNNTLEILKSIESQINKKEYFKNDEGLQLIQTSYQGDDKVIKAFFRLVKRFSETSRLKLSDERKLSEKSIKSYEGELEKMNNLISQYEIKLKQKEQQYQDLYKSFVELQKQSQPEDQKKSSSLRGSRKSVRSSSSDKESQIKNIKASMQVFADQEKNMLERLQMAEQEKIALVQRINYLEHQLNGSVKTVQQLRLTIKALQKNISDEHNNYQREYESWRQKAMFHSKQIETVRLQYEKQFEKKEQKIVLEFENISREREIALEKYHRDLSNVQTQLNKEITLLREQLRLKNVQIVKNQDFDALRKNNQTLEIEYSSLKSKLAQFQIKVNSAEQLNAQLQNVLKENGQNQAQVISLTSKNRELEQEIQRMKANNERTLQEQRNRVGSIDQTNVQLQNKIRENGQLQQEINNLTSKNRQLDQEIINLRSNLERVNQEDRNSKQRISTLQSEIRTIKSTTSTTVTSTTASTARITELEQQLAKLKAQQEQIITNEINLALKNQEEDFNRFLAVHDQEIETHFFTIIIPEKIKESTQSITTTTKEVIKEVIKPDPRQESTINQLRLKVDEQVRLFRELEQKYINEQNQKNRLMQSSKNMSDYRVLQDNLKRVQQNLDQINKKYNQEVETNRVLRNDLNMAKSIETNLKEEIKKVQLSWEVKFKEQITINERKIYEIQHRVQEKPQEFKILEAKIEQLNRKIIEEKKANTDLENHLNRSITIYEARIQEVVNEKALEINRVTNEANMLRDKTNDLTLRLTEKEKQIRHLEQSSRNNQSSLSNFHHQDCEKKYKEMEQRLNKEILEHRNRLADASKSGREEIELLKEVINNQKIESKKFETMLNSFREAKDEAIRQKETYFNQLKAISNQKDVEIHKIRTEYENRITTISIEKATLQNKLSQGLQSGSRVSDSTTPIKVIELESKLNNKEQQLRSLTELSEKRRRELQEQNQRLVFVERENENMKMIINNMENHIMRLETDISYFNNEVHKYKMALIETESRESVLRNDLMRVKTQNDNDTNVQHLREEINSLKDQIIRITSTNINQIQTLTAVNVESFAFDSVRIRKMIHTMESHRGSEKYGYDEDQLEILRRINQEVTQLVGANRQLQTKCSILESNLHGENKFLQNVDFLLMLQDRMQALMNFLLDKYIIDNAENYSKYIYTSREILAVNDMEAYFNNWLNFMKSLFLLSNDLKSQELRQKAEEMLDLKEQMNQILDKHIQFVEDQSYETLDKYKMIFSDIKILIREYLNTKNEEYIHMIWRSLEPHEAIAQQH